MNPDEPRTLPARAMRTMMVFDAFGVAIIVVDQLTGGPTWYTGLGIAMLVLGGAQFALRLVAANAASVAGTGTGADVDDQADGPFDDDDARDDGPPSPITFH